MNLREQTKYFINISQNLLEFNKNIIINKYKNNSNINNDQIENIINWLENNKQYFKDKHALWLVDFIIDNNYYKNLKANENDLYQLLNFTKYIDKYNFKKEKYKTINDIDNEINKIKQEKEIKKTQRDIQDVKIDKFNNYTIYKLTNKDIDLITKLSKFGHKYGIPPKFDIPADAQYFSDWCIKNKNWAKSYSDSANYLYIIIDPESYPFIAMDDHIKKIKRQNDNEIKNDSKESKFLENYLSSNNHIIEDNMIKIIAPKTNINKLLQKYYEYDEYKGYYIYKIEIGKYKIVDKNNNKISENKENEFLIDYIENSNNVIFDNYTLKKISFTLNNNQLLQKYYKYDKYQNYYIYHIYDNEYKIIDSNNNLFINIVGYRIINKNNNEIKLNSKEIKFLEDYLLNSNNIIFNNDIIKNIIFELNNNQLLQKHYEYDKYKDYYIYKGGKYNYKIIDINNNLFIQIAFSDILNKNDDDIKKDSKEYKFLLDYINNSNNVIFNDDTINNIRKIQ